MYCGTDSTWATVEDLYIRFGDEYMDKLATRRIFDIGLQEYVADESIEGRLRVVSVALCDAKQLIIQKLRCLYSDLSPLESSVFSGLKQWHIKLTIETLKIGGDCLSCACVQDIDNYIKCGAICNDDGTCLSKNTTFLSATEAVFCCERQGCGCCC